MQPWQVEAWITWMQTNPNAWRITSSICDQDPNNSPDHKRDTYEKLLKYNNTLKTPRGKILLKMETMDEVRKRCYNWNSWSKERAKKENGTGSTGRTTLKILTGIDKEIYELFYGKRLPNGASSPTVSDEFKLSLGIQFTSTNFQWTSSGHPVDIQWNFPNFMCPCDVMN